MFTPDVSFLSVKVFTRLELTCSSPMEWAFYASTKISYKRIYVVIASGRTSQNVLPFCLSCKEKGKNPLTRGLLGRKKQWTFFHLI